ncbi:MAG: VIT1/CCC1 transporter family protein, partial [Candidatus Micrarchaeota archaeon]
MNVKEHFQGIAFGLMDGIITLIGILIGVAEATGNAKLVIVSGLVGGLANSFGNSIGFYTSENAERGQQLEFYKDHKGGREKKYIHSHGEIIASSVLSFLATFSALVFPIIP